MTNFILKGDWLHGLGYFIFFYVSIFVIEILSAKFQFTNTAIKKPKKEIGMTILFIVIGIVALILNFSIKNSETQVGLLYHIPVMFLMFFFTLPVGLFIYLLINKYRLKELGLKFKPIKIFLLGIIIWVTTGLFALIFNYDGVLWSAGYKELGGTLGIILQGVLGAALVEEFTRYILQTRFQYLIKNTGFSILLASFIWAFMHFPVNYFKGNEISGIFTYCIQIIPLGFIWGFITHRTKSILPSVFAHGLNLWGFQNG
ncbi:MAG: hypothetical protein COA97_06550 [Flavobacteriales bacterium]|nr:MAG: hypothetical protein COA97_06550 [Flavobacteriales bacterium]